MNLSKIISITLYALLGISALLGVLFYTSVITEEPFIIWVYILTIVAAAMAVIFPIVYMIMNPKNAKGVIYGVSAMIIIIGISYIIASDTILVFPNYKDFNITESISKYIGTALFSMYLLAIFAFVSIIFTEVMSFFK